MKKLCIVCILLIISGVVCARGRRASNADEVSAFTWAENIGNDSVPQVNPLLVKGNVVTAGSSTVGPLAAKIVERYKQDGFQGQITIDIIGSGAGFERFTVSGETDVSNASRAIKKSEVENALKNGRRPIPFRIGTDALSVVVAKNNTFIHNASNEELAGIFSSAIYWNDINPDWPAELIYRYIPGTDSGTFDFFVETVFHGNVEPLLSASNIQFSEDDNVLVQGVSSNPYAVAFFGYAYYVENKDVLKILSIEEIIPNEESIERAESDTISQNVALGGYPLARPLFIYSDAHIMRSKPHVAAYIAYFIHNVNDVIYDVGYFPANLESAKNNWQEAMDGVF